MTRPVRVLTASIALLLVVATGAVLVQPLRDMRRDIHAQRGLLAQQLDTTQAQLVALRAQLETAQEMRTVLDRTDERSAALLALTKVLAELARQTAADVDRGTGAALRTEDLSAQLRDVARRIEALARSTERHAASLDHKTGPTVR
jgi:hypothetical protein